MKDDNQIKCDGTSLKSYDCPYFDSPTGDCLSIESCKGIIRTGKHPEEEYAIKGLDIIKDPVIHNRVGYEKVKWETVQSWEERYGKEWPQDAPVWYRTYKSCRWRFALRYEAQHVRKHDTGKKSEPLEFIELIADESGTPTADWREQ